MQNLDGKIPGAPNFRYREFIKSDVAIRNGISNMPAEDQWKNIERLSARVLQPVRNRFGPLKITSGFRSPELNKKIGGSTSSNHCKGEAADIEPVSGNVKLIDIIKFIHDNLEFRNLIAEFLPDGWVHVDYREGRNIKRLKIKDEKRDYEEVNIDYLVGLYG